MYVLEATTETRGKRDDDYAWTVDGELVFVPSVECPDPLSGCARGFAGTTSQRATTTAKVVDRPELDGDAYRRAPLAAMSEQGYDFGGKEPLDEFVDEMVRTVQAAAKLLGDGAIVGRSGTGLSVRRRGG